MIRVFLKSFLSGGSFPLVAVAGAVALYGAGYIKGSSSSSDKAAIERLEREKTALSQDKQRLEQQIKVASDAVSAANEQSDEDAKRIEELKGKVDDFENGLGSKDKRFILDDDDVRRLLGK